MSKVYNYMILAVGLTFLLKFAGIPSGADKFIEFLGLAGDASGISLGTFISGVVILFAVGTGAGITISFFTKSSSESYLVAPVALGILTVMIGTFVSIINYTKNMGFIYYIVWLIFIPLTLAFGIAIINFWRGND